MQDVCGMRRINLARDDVKRSLIVSCKKITMQRNHHCAHLKREEEKIEIN